MRVRLLTVLILFWLGGVLGHAQTDELLTNVYFTISSDGRLADRWSDGSTALPRAPVFSIMPQGPGGRAVQRVTLPALGGGRFRLMQTLEAPPPGLYRLRATMRANTRVHIELVLRTLSEPRTGYGVTRETIPAGDWREVTGYARVPTRNDRIAFVVLLGDAATVWLASASLQAVDESTLSPAEQDRVRRVLGPPLPPVDEASLLAASDERIRQNRTAPLTIQVRDVTGRRLAGVKVRVNQERHLFWFGAGYDRAMTQPDRTEIEYRHREGFLRLFDAATVHLSADSYDPRSAGRYTAAMGEALDWLESHHIRAMAHPLFWSLMRPEGMSRTTPVEAVRAWTESVLAQAATTGLGRFDDVVIFNEVVNWDRFSTPLAPVLTPTASGPAGGGKGNEIAYWLRRCRALNPRVVALINDYDTTPEYYFLLQQVIDAGGSLDAIGLQSHMHNGVWSVTHLWDTLNRLALLKRPVFFTELSVPSGEPRAFNFQPADPPWETTPAGEAAQADYLEMFYRLVYSHPAAAGVIYWDYSDRSAWLGCPVGLLRKDGSLKPAFRRLDRLINDTWRTRGEFTSGADGRVVVPQAFEGEYRISAGSAEVRGEHSAAKPLEAVLMVRR